MLRVILCYLMPYVNFFLIIIVVCLKTFFLLRIYLTLIYHTLNLNFSKFPFNVELEVLLYVHRIRSFVKDGLFLNDNKVLSYIAYVLPAVNVNGQP